MGRPVGTTKQFCKNGHDTTILGRTKSRYCIACSRTGNRPGRLLGPQKRYCCNGHDTDVVGRHPSGTCRACQRVINWTARARDREGLPAVRLRSLTRDRLGAASAWMAYRGVDWTSALRAADRLYAFDSLSIDQADRWCIALQTHLAIVYPEVYETDTIPWTQETA